jgi:hypothetical protein
MLKFVFFFFNFLQGISNLIILEIQSVYIEACLNRIWKLGDVYN